MLSRRIIILKCLKNGLIDYNWNYETMKKIYEAYTIQDKIKANRLHNEGFITDNKIFKLINFMILFQNNDFVKEGIKVKENDEIRLVISGKNDIINDIIKGFIQQGSFNLYDISFKIANVENDKSFNFKNTMLYKVNTPVVEGIWDNGNKYLSIYDNRFYSALAQNLKRKYKLIYNEDFEDELYFDIDNILKVKQKSINKIKGEGFVKGFGNFEIWLQTSPKMQKIAYYLGLGQNSSLGAGCISYITGRR